ncbi:MBL fold metallo-hydrolase [uncultured Clostridium sp.]|uniref:MBL fold metallo-hydrolase n=1 Tax=uncultured Clostridium sp. TaxID=59620 RepID=UPI0028E45597|nr:MBL fold metallo-hydrolase [uncultured Clostridium sp.]
MDKYRAKINYLYHDGFSVQTENHLLIFDYYKDSSIGEVRNLDNGVVGEEDLKIKDNVLVFSSHGHKDHFNPVILDWVKYNPNINYVLSSDITLPDYKKNYNILWSNKELQLGDVLIKTFESTDIGVCYLVEVDGLSIFHSGDFNWWHWKDDPMEDNLEMELAFKKEMRKIAEHDVDIAFFPTDPRLDEFFYVGGEYFIDKVKPKLFIPMHFWAKSSITKKFKDKVQRDFCEVVEIKNRGQVIEFLK